MVPLPKCRVTPGFWDFSCAGVDYFGPILVKVGCKHAKRYRCLFTCMVCRAVHLEVAYSLTINSFLQAFFRFVHRRGPVQEMHSDRGTNFLFAERELCEGVRRWNQSQIHKSLRQKGVEWHFNPPSRRPVGERGRFPLNRSRRFCIPLPVSELWTMKLSTHYWSKLKMFWTIDRLHQSETTHGTNQCWHRHRFSTERWTFAYLLMSISKQMVFVAHGDLCNCFWKRWVKGVSTSTPTSSEAVKTLKKSSRWRCRSYAWNKH